MHSLTKKKSAKHLEIRFHAYLQNKVKLPWLAESYESRENARASGEAARGRGKAPRSRVPARLA